MSKLRRFALSLAIFSFITVGMTEAQTDSPCGAGTAASEAWSDVSQFGHGLTEAPRSALKAKNLKWELPLAAATGVLIGELDQPIAHRNESLSLQQTAGRWSNIGIGLELGIGGLTWVYGCGKHHPYAAESGFKALEAAGLGLAVDLGLKAMFNRQYPYTPNSNGEFWEGGKSFPSGHSAISFAFASAMAHRYPHNRWIKWGSYGLATGVSLSRFGAKKHYPSDILIGAPVGYLIGTYVVNHGN